MKYSLLALAASTVLTSVSARHIGRRHAHPKVDLLPREEECPQTCSTYVTTIVRAKTIAGTAPYYGTAPTGVAGTGAAPAGTGIAASSAGSGTTTYTVSPIYATSAPASSSSEIAAVSSVVPAAEESTSCSEYVLTTIISSVVYSTATSVSWVSPVPEETSAASVPASVPASSAETAPASSVETSPASSAEVSPASSPSSVETAPVSSVPSVETTPASSTEVSPASSAPASSVPVSSAVSSEVSPASSAATPISTSPVTSVKPLPTPLVTTCSTTGVYTIPATTVTLTTTETTVIPKTVTLTRGVNTYGGSTTSVPSATTLTVPVATVATTEGTTTSFITQTTYYCPYAGSYTIGASTSTVTVSETVVTCPGVTSYTPGTYTQTELTTTITKTNEVITCPFEGTETTLTAGASSAVATGVPASTTAVATSATPSASSVAASSVPSSSTELAATASSSAPSSSSTGLATSSAPSSSSTELAATASSSASKTSSAVASPSSTSSGKGLDTTGLWSIAYSPYDDNGACKGEPDIATDIADIAKRGFKNVRLYSTDCSGLDYVGSACESNGMGLIAGIFIKEGGVSTGDEQVSDLLAWGKWDLVELLVVGNEAVYNNYCSASELADFISATAQKVSGAGYTGKVTTTEPVNIIQQNADVLCPVMDIVGANVQPYFDGSHTAEQAGTFAKSQLGLATTACGGSKAGVILEIGWPTAGSPHGVAIASSANQKTALTAVESELPGQCNYFTYRNDLWKEAGDLGVETHFGCADVFAIGANVNVGGVSASVSASVSY